MARGQCGRIVNDVVWDLLTEFEKEKNMCDKLNRFEEIAKSHGFEDVLLAIRKIRNQDKVALGILGPFSARRAAFANRLFGTAFPESLDDGIKTVCRIESGGNDQVGITYYLEGDDGVRKEISQEDMKSLAVDEKCTGHLLAVVPCNPVLSVSVCFVFPGLHVTAEEDARILGSMSMMDAFCYVVSTNLSEDDISVVTSPVVSNTPEAVSFVLAHVDTKDPVRTNSILRGIARNVKELAPYMSVEENVVAVDVNDSVGLGKYAERLVAMLLKNRSAMLASRADRNADEVLEMLKRAIARRTRALELPQPDMSDEKQKYYEKIQLVRREEDELKRRFDNVGTRIGLVLKNEFANLKWDFLAASTQEERTAVIGDFLNNKLNEIIVGEYRREFGDINEGELGRCIDRTPVLKALNELNSRAKRSAQISDLFNVVGTAALMAYLGPAEGAGNFVEGLVGAFLGSQTDEHAFGGLKKFNPVAVVSDIAGDLYRDSAFDEYIRKMEMIGRTIGRGTYAFLEKLYLEPRRLEMTVARNEIQQIENKRIAGLLNVAEERRVLDAERKELEVM